MALIKYSPLVGAVAGKVGGVTFVSKGRGASVRGCASTVERDSVAAAKARARHQAGVAGWLALTDAQRGTWRARALGVLEPNALGVVRALSGIELYERVAMRCRLMGLSVPTSAPATVHALPSRITGTYGVSNGYLNLTCVVPGGSAPYRWLVSVACQREAGNRRVLRRWKPWFYWSGSSLSLSFSVVTHLGLGWIPPSGTRIGVRLEGLTGGYFSAPSEVETVYEEVWHYF